MEWSDYVMERVATARLGELRAHSARLRLLTQSADPRPGPRVALGLALIHLGRRLARGGAEVRNGSVRVARVR
ncbi:MAG TPA: hypothetical protein VFE48_00585 [Methylomirabilota bacterium]|nr:hypothetical protein [Methylomirabilota bacterium]